MNTNDAIKNQSFVNPKSAEDKALKSGCIVSMMKINVIPMNLNWKNDFSKAFNSKSIFLMSVVTFSIAVFDSAPTLSIAVFDSAPA